MALQGPRPALPEDFDSLIELADECFPSQKALGGMRAAWGHCYDPRPEKLRQNLIMKDGSKVVAHVGCIDQTLVVEGCEVRVVGISGVSTWPTYRKQGLMSRLLEYALEHIRAEGYAFSDLGGDRVRYGRYGWENAGREWSFTVTRRSLQWAGSVPSVTIGEYHGTQAEVEAIAAIHDAEPLRAKRTLEQYALLLGRGGKQVWLAMDGGHITAYLVSCREGEQKSCRVDEFGGSAEGVHALISHLLAPERSESVGIRSPYIHPLNALFFKISSGWSVATHRMLRICDLAATLRGFARQLGRRYASLGFKGRRSVQLGVAETGERAVLRFGGEEVSVEPPSSRLPVLELPRRDMVRLLFGPGGPSCTVPLPPQAAFLEALLPLDYYIWRNETV